MVPAGPVAPLFIDTSDLYFNVGTGLNSGVQFSMTNMGTTTLSYTFSISGDGFEVVPFGCEFPLDAGQTCQAAVGYTAAAGLGASTSKSAVLTVTTNEGVKTASVMATELGTCQLNRYMLNYGVSTYNGLNYANPLNHIGPYDYSNASAYARFLSEPNTTADSVTFQSGSDILSQYSSTVVTSGATRTRWAKTSDSSFGTAVDLYSYEASESMGPWVATGDYRGADRVVGNTNRPGDLAQPIPALPATAEGTGAVVFIGSQSQFIKRDPKSEIRVTAQVGWGERITYYPQYSTQNSQQANYVAAQINGACDIKSRNVAGMFGWVTSQLYLVCYNVDPASYAAFLANGTMTGNQAGFAAKFPRGVAASTGL